MKKETLSFWTTGEGFTKLLTDFFEEGRYKALYETLEDGGLSYEMIIAFFYGLIYFDGDTRGDGTLSVHTKETADKPQDERFYWSFKNFMSNQTNRRPDTEDDEDEDDDFAYYKYPKMIDALDDNAWRENEELQFLAKIITRQSLIEMIWKRVLNSEGWPVNVDPDKIDLGAVILRSGDVVQCPYMCHTTLFPILYRLGLASSPDWTDDEWTMHVSSGQVGGAAGHAVDSYMKDREIQATPEQIQALVKYKKVFKKMYSGWNTLFETLREYFIDKEDHGSKYGQLVFLKTCYPNISLPLFGKEPIDGVKNCLRTSPLYSLPGLLESKFELTENSISEIEETYKKYENVREGNQLHYFYQEFIPGINGVCHRSADGFSYAIGDNQGDVVQGKASGERLTRIVERDLRKIADEIYTDLNNPIQLEFVVSKNNEVVIVQLRKLSNPYERTVQCLAPTGVIVKGRTFSKGNAENLNLDEILIVDEDAPSEALLGKKALIVKSMVEFSHILALSQALKIPSIYGTGDFKLPKDKVSIKAFNADGYIYK